MGIVPHCGPLFIPQCTLHVLKVIGHIGEVNLQYLPNEVIVIAGEYAKVIEVY
jgi:hypothetical protein